MLAIIGIKKAVPYTDKNFHKLIRLAPLCIDCANPITYANHLLSFWKSKILSTCQAEDNYVTISQ